MNLRSVALIIYGSTDFQASLLTLSVALAKVDEHIVQSRLNHTIVLEGGGGRSDNFNISNNREHNL